MPEKMPDRMSEQIPGTRMPERVSEYMPKSMSEQMPDRMSDRMSKYMPERMSDIVRQNVRIYKYATYTSRWYIRNYVRIVVAGGEFSKKVILDNLVC